MTPLPNPNLRPRRNEAGQAFIEFTLIVGVLAIMLFGLIDFCRALYAREVLVNLSREGANLASRGTGSTPLEIMSNAVDAVIAESGSINLATNGLIIVSSVTNNGTGGSFVSQQVKAGRLSANSKVGIGVGAIALLPTATPAISQPQHTVFVAEVYYKFTPITPIGKLIKVTLPTSLYDAAYFATW